MTEEHLQIRAQRLFLQEILREGQLIDAQFIERVRARIIARLEKSRPDEPTGWWGHPDSSEVDRMITHIESIVHGALGVIGK